MTDENLAHDPWTNAWIGKWKLGFAKQVQTVWVVKSYTSITANNFLLSRMSFMSLAVVCLNLGMARLPIYFFFFK